MRVLGRKKTILRIAEENFRIKGQTLDSFQNLRDFFLLLFQRGAEIFECSSLEILEIYHLGLSLCLFISLTIHQKILLIFLDVLSIVLLQLGQPIFELINLALSEEVEQHIVKGRVPSVLVLSLDFSQIGLNLVGLLLCQLQILELILLCVPLASVLIEWEQILPLDDLVALENVFHLHVVVAELSRLLFYDVA